MAEIRGAGCFQVLPAVAATTREVRNMFLWGFFYLPFISNTKNPEAMGTITTGPEKVPIPTLKMWRTTRIEKENIYKVFYAHVRQYPTTLSIIKKKPIDLEL